MAREFQDILTARYSRRALLKTSAFTAAAVLLPLRAMAAKKPALKIADASGLTFKEISKALINDIQVPEGYESQMFLRWGDPIFKDAPEFNPDMQTAEDQSRQFGINNDYIAFFPLPRGSQNSDHGILSVNHEYPMGEMMFMGITLAGEAAEVSEKQIKTEQQSVGVSVMEVVRENGEWRLKKDSRYNRRLTATTPMELSGPAAGDVRMQTKADKTGRYVLGTLANCAGGVTPWHSALTCEENFNDYFSEPQKEGVDAANHKRYGIGKSHYPKGWLRFDTRFDSRIHPNEVNRFGWVVEHYPYEPSRMPKKRTALGRFKHESATCILMKDGRVAVYMGDDEAFEYLYRFVSKSTYNDTAPDADLLDEGTLSVAKFREDGTLQWLPLVHGQNGLTEKSGFKSQADVLIETRRAGDVVGATPMDRPEDIEVSLATGKVYVSLTKNTLRVKTDAANPRPVNRHGHIIELLPPDGDHSADTFKWDIFIRGGNPRRLLDAARYPGSPSKEGFISCPDNLAFDNKGNLWICTDGQNASLKKSDSVYATATEGASRGTTKLFMNIPRGAEVTGPCFTPDGTTLFVSIQHPGEEGDADFNKPSTRWPDFKEGMPSRPSVIAITKKDGGVVGS